MDGKTVHVLTIEIDAKEHVAIVSIEKEKVDKHVHDLAEKLAKAKTYSDYRSTVQITDKITLGVSIGNDVKITLVDLDEWTKNNIQKLIL